MLKRQLAMIVFTLCMLTSYAQVKINGLVYDEYLEPFYGAKVTHGKNYTASNTDGEFSIVLTSDVLPQTITVSAFGYKTEKVIITSLEKKVNVILKENILLDQVIISASRIPERIIESPVTVERFGINDIKRNTSNSFYDGLTNLKGIQSREGSYGFKSVNTRGFSDFSNSRFVQLVDGMDTAAPALNFSPGNLGGISELDIHSVEILPGASSALYGANAYNGIMLMNTKSPFDFTGISVLLKSGVTNQNAAGTNPFYDATIRMAYKFNEYFAAKANLSYFEAEEWHANDYRNREVDTNEITNGDINSTPNYDGVNTYGDEIFSDLSFFSNAFPAGSLIRRTGYRERELLESYESNNLKFSGSLHFRPFQDESLEIILATRLAMGDNLFQGTSRYAQRNYYIGQSKFEVKGDNFYARVYYTRNDAGNSYDLTTTGIALNEASTPFGVWLNSYFNELVKTGSIGSIVGARRVADANRLTPGTEAFQNAFNTITSTKITEGGSKIYDRSSYIHADGNYNFASLVNDWADIQVGGSFRQYNPDSQGTIFNDANESIKINEYGVYGQIQKKFLDERLKITTSLRYDKSQNFEGNYSPRFAVNYALGEDKGHILRASYQTGFRNPTIQEQYLFLNAGVKTNVGATKDNLDRIQYNNVDFIPLLNDFFASTTTGDEIINNALLTKSVYDSQTYLKSDYTEIKPESVKTFETGYRSILRLNNNTNLDLDINAFYSQHKDFVFFQDVVVPNYGTVYPNGTKKLTDAELALPANQGAFAIDNVVVLDPVANIAFNNGHVREFNLITNAKSEVESFGFGIGMHTKLFRNFDIGVNYNFIDYRYEDLDLGLFEPNFNTPKHTAKVQFGNDKLFKNFGFNINARWTDKYRWVSPYVKGDIDARTVIDAQLNYRIPSFKSVFKVGGTNLFGEEYMVAPGAGRIGQLYYISWIINN
ncbi:CarboxypepD_reg-like domain-containing protein [Tenacibaculum sp. 190524A02b]|uniref:TonB-dependent receptor plug domain-containing protein n=1 Tax=Tenacibaculum vairaonense TaxID=3137860 RepID=UPI0032B1EEA4